jgi:RNA polymerase sigma factor (sigma-70 family)
LQTREEEKQFEKQVREHELLLHKVCHMYAYTDADRQDLFQDIVLQVWKAYPKFKGDAKFSTWLYRVALNTAITGLRKKDFITSYQPAEVCMQLTNQNTNEAKEERWQQLYAAIGQLTEVEKAIIMLYLEQRSYSEMEEILGISQGNLRVKMNRIKDKLRQLTKTNSYGTR